MLSIVSQHYHCVYRVSLNNDTIHQLIMPDYLKKYAEEEATASKVFSRYVHEMVHPDFQRVLLNFLNYDALKKHLAEGNIPSVTYTNAADEIICLSIHSISKADESAENTIWVYEKINER
ncbi:MAG: hypothetical protein IJ365_05330 [Clostridia bacterium]|nr:hypothetical protein [Clostridia bacterium]